MNAATIGRFIVVSDYASGELAPTSGTVETFGEAANCARSIRGAHPQTGRRGRHGSENLILAAIIFAVFGRLPSTLSREWQP
jgi:hypothetical protein